MDAQGRFWSCVVFKLLIYIDVVDVFWTSKDAMQEDFLSAKKYWEPLKINGSFVFLGVIFEVLYK